MSEQSRQSFAIVGGGPAGMSLARAFAHYDVPFVVLERNHDVGGIWDADNPGSPIYESAHFISSRGQSGYVGFPMPEDYPDYPGARQILEYHRAFARAYDLKKYVRFNAEVTQARPLESGGWHVTLADGDSIEAGGLVCANGTTWVPNIPDLPGKFDGEIRHAVTYRRAEEFAGKRVLVVGAGNSGCDIACDAAQAADAAFISLRRGYHFIPKHIFGMPADEFAEKGPPLPMWASQLIFGAMLRLLHGDLTRLGLQAPDHRVFETHPIVNDQLLHYLRHGDVSARPDIQRLDGRFVEFTDGRRDEVDLIILATGYQHAIPYLPEGVMDWQGSRPDLYMNLFSRRHPGLMALGFMETDGGAYKMFDLMANVIAQHARDLLQDPEQVKRLQAITQEHPDLSGGVKYLKTERNANYVNHKTYLKELERLRKRMGWQPLDEKAMMPAQPAAASA